MLETAYFKALRLLLIAGSLSSYANAMEIEVDDLELEDQIVSIAAESIIKKEDPDASLQTTTNLDFHEDEKLINRIPRSLKYLIALSPFFTNPAIHSDLDPNIDWKSIVDGAPKARENFFAKCVAYKDAEQYYNRAQRVHAKAPSDKTLKELNEKRETFEEIQLWFLLKFSPLDKLIELNKRKTKVGESINKYDTKVEIFKYIFNTEDFKDEIENIKKIVRKPKGVGEFKPKAADTEVQKSILKTEKKPSKAPGFPVEPHKLAVERVIMKKFRSILDREDDILYEVCEPYSTYTLEVTGIFYPRKWVNWSYDTPRPETEEEIQSNVNAKYPYGPLTLRLINQQIDLMNDRDLLLYKHKNILYFAMANKASMEIQISKDNKTYGSKNPRLRQNVYKRVLEALRAKVPHLSPADQSHLLNFAFLSGYCLEDSYNPCVQATLMAMGKARETFEKLEGRIKWSERSLSKGFRDEESPADQMQALEARYKNLKKHDSEKYESKEEEEREKEEREKEKLMRQDYFYLYKSKQTLEHARKICSPAQYPDLPSYITLYHHRSKMIKVLEEFEEDRYRCPGGQNDAKPHYLYNTQELKEHEKEYNALKPFLIEHLKFVQYLDLNVGYKVSGPLSAYQSETYREETLPEELNLAHCQLGDDNFFYEDKLNPREEPESYIHSVNVEKEKQGLRLLFHKPSKDALKSIQKGELGLYSLPGYAYGASLYCKVYDNTERLIVSSDDGGCPSATYNRLLKAMSYSPENVDQLVSHIDKRALFHYTARIGYTKEEYLLEKFEKINLFGNELVGQKKPTFSPNLRELDIGHNYLASTAIVSGLKQLEKLDARDNFINSIEGLETCPFLTYLNLERREFRKSEDIGVNGLKGLNAFYHLKRLTYLNLARHSLKTTGFLDVPTLNTLTDLNVSHNNFTTPNFFTHLTNLKKIDISYNKFIDLTPFMYLKSLKEINANHNELTGVVMKYFSPVEGRLHLTDLRSLDVAYNPKTLTFSPSNASDLTKENYKQLGPNLKYLRLMVGHNIVEHFWAVEEQKELIKNEKEYVVKEVDSL